jgi:hypothetical protein
MSKDESTPGGSETPTIPELTPDDRDRFRDWIMQHMEMGMQSNPASFARAALEYATLHARMYPIVRAAADTEDQAALWGEIFNIVRVSYNEHEAYSILKENFTITRKP